MRFAIATLAALALVGDASATQVIKTRLHAQKLADDRMIQEFTVDDFGFIVLGQQTIIRKESDELADGDAADDKEVEDTRDSQDEIVEDSGFVRNWLQTNSKVHTKKESDELANGDAADDKELEDTRDSQDGIVEDTGFVRNFVEQRQYLQMSEDKYSDELANGDSADDRDIHEDEDMNDDVVDVNGQTNAGYGSKNMMSFFDGNHIAAGHFVTEA
uniref:RxLR effector protein n=1 Tax=Strombidium rassoulzadegani TaxID=1082188 RepID=A0A7S3FSN0_9SPIT|mmetsp:Transcript_11789/g.19904  ORF Transcript_11789/g.19904 Transcript_11789/m.19904 type:complete len:216 (+) Transcript_11789:27-674(+)